MKVIGLVQSKGGVGKTTTAINLGAELARRGHVVRVYDADPAGHAAAVAADGLLAFPVDAHPLEDAGEARAWGAKVLSTVADFVLVDAPGSMGAAYGATVAIADLVLVPSGATILDIRGAGETVRFIRQRRRESGSARPDVLVIPSRIDRRTSAGKDVIASLSAMVEPVAPIISDRAVVADSLGAGEPVPPDSASAGEYAALADAVLVRLGAVA